MTDRRSLLKLAAVLACPTPGFARTQPWTKRGLVLAPGFAGAFSAGLLSAPCVVPLENGRLRMYFWGREAAKPGAPALNYIYAAEASTADPLRWSLVRPEPLLGPSPGGNVSNLGPSFPWVLPRQDSPWLMYYCAWGSWAPPVELSNRASLAISEDQGVTWKVLRDPLLPLGKRGSFDGGLTGSVCVLRTAPDQYRMWYTAGERYEIFDGAKRGIVHIGYAASRDGLQWAPAKKPLLSPRLDNVTPYEAVVSKPSVLRLGGTYHMWLSVFAMQGKGYRLGYARSRDGLRWERSLDQEILPLTPGGFDSINQSYPNVIEAGDELWMFYAGDRFGSTGIGLATLKKSALA
ncbi:MAG: hypothetical protein FJW37_10450 [Acidobacteria bacterium]|nr:hypothetical protein [Acidobacteriota bacterium]